MLDANAPYIYTSKLALLFIAIVHDIIFNLYFGRKKLALKNKSSIDESSYVRVTYRGKFIKLRLRVYTIIRDSRVGNTNKVVRGAAKS